ncbi:MAG: hypothetical protein SP1CHLAM54_00360 [Chlamydiia bacterium]|nr:hypothetical protein [Chlamydiia bacterium]MCH9614958.1 hypothetical protein [Chlamydiia bacterium]MCH9629992.1 hypothetical protein [Chlamydiia bacterium]
MMATVAGGLDYTAQALKGAGNRIYATGQTAVLQTCTHAKNTAAVYRREGAGWAVVAAVSGVAVTAINSTAVLVTGKTADAMLERSRVAPPRIIAAPVEVEEEVEYSVSPIDVIKYKAAEHLLEHGVDGVKRQLINTAIGTGIAALLLFAIIFGAMHAKTPYGLSLLITGVATPVITGGAYLFKRHYNL